MAVSEFASGHAGLNPREWNALIGIITAIVGNILISFALNIQRYAHIRLHKDSLKRKRSWKSAKRRRKAADIPNYGTQLEIAEERAQANKNAPLLDEHDEAHRERYHHVDGAEDEADERAPLKGSNTTRSSSSETITQHKSEEDGGNEKTSYLKSPYWWLGIILMTTGEAGNFIAYGFAPASIVSPLGVVALISNCIIAPLLLKEHFRQRDFWGVLIAIGGAVTVVLSARMTDPKLGPNDIWDAITRWEFELYLGITGGLIVLLMWASGRYGNKSIMIDIGLVGLFGGYTALSTKGVASLLTDTIWRAVTFPIFYILVFVLVTTAVFQIRYVNRALARFDSTRVVPTQFVSFTLSVIIGSAILYREFESTTAERAGKFVGGCALTFLGVYFITSGKRNSPAHEDVDEDAGEVEAIHLVDDEARGQESNTSAAGDYRIQVDGRVADLDDNLTPRNSPPTADVQTGVQPQTPQRTISAASDASLPLSSTSGISPFSDNPWTDTDHFSNHVNLPQASLSAPLLPAEASRKTSRPTTPSPVSNSNKPQTHSPLTSRVSTLSRSSISHLIPGPISSPLSSSLSAIVADQIRRGVEVTPRRPATLHRTRSNVLDAEDSAAAVGRARSVSNGGLAGLFRIQRSKSDKGDLEAGRLPRREDTQRSSNRLEPNDTEDR